MRSGRRCGFDAVSRTFHPDAHYCTSVLALTNSADLVTRKDIVTTLNLNVDRRGTVWTPCRWSVYIKPVRTNNDQHRQGAGPHGVRGAPTPTPDVNLQDRIFKAWPEFSSGRYTAKNGQPKRHDSTRVKNKRKKKGPVFVARAFWKFSIPTDRAKITIKDEKDLTAMVGYIDKVRHPVLTGRNRQKLQTLQ
ncbi:hypothetical protein Bbelb_243180 [Branchiostoma belcheri]|nr:hypothetical protein Bbelb_243180 [Branchiostoma belcheri]